MKAKIANWDLTMLHRTYTKPENKKLFDILFTHTPQYLVLETSETQILMHTSQYRLQIHVFAIKNKHLANNTVRACLGFMGECFTLKIRQMRHVTLNAFNHDEDKRICQDI